LNNLLSLNAKYIDRCRELGFDPKDAKPLAMTVGFPLIEKASLQNDEYLQQRWANLLEQATNPNNTDTSSDFELDTTYVESLAQFSRLDCEVLEYIVEHGVRYVTIEGDTGRGLAVDPIDPNVINEEFPDSPAHISVEKLVLLGCAYRELKTPLSSASGHTYGPFQRTIIPTLIGLNLYISSSGKQPSWVTEE
jgi:hypothetical protein